MKDFFENEKYKKVVVAIWLVVAVAIIAFVAIFISFSKKLKSTADIGLLTSNSVNVVVPNNETKTASTSEDKDINAVANEVLNKIDNTAATTKNVSSEEKVSENKIKENVAAANPENKDKTEEKKEEKKPLEFMAPVAGDIMTDYADESLVYSNTLKEWTTHLGIDIKAEKASTVVASEAGTVKSIKNDPRYGLSITIEHDDGYRTVYSSLLSSEFVNEGDTVEKGQTIGTVGESASFEVSEAPHLHFEVYKDGNSVNPTTLLK